MIEQILKWLIGQIDYRFYIPLIIDFLKSLIWPFTIILLFFIFRKQIPHMLEKLESLEVFGTKIKWNSRGEDAAPSLTKLRTKIVTPHEKDIALVERQAINDLIFLLSNYQFVWGAWAMGPEYCHAVRFSEKYSGGTLHFIDEYARELNSFIKDKGDKIPENISIKLEELSSYINGVLPYHEEQERLSRPVFSIPQYMSLLRTLASGLEVPILEVPNQPA